jgi:hypothetical protein
MRTLAYITLMAALFSSCAASKEKKTDKYYYENEKDILEIVSLYKGLFNHQPFSLGFSDRSYDHIGMDIITDTVRYAVDNLQSMDKFREAVYLFKYDTVSIRKLYLKMYAIRCIWVGTTEIFYKGQKEDVMYLTFRSVRFGSPFLDRKYYTLAIFDPRFINEETDRLIREAGYKKVKNEIYFNIIEKFRM